jgi:hypothetical protein
MADDWAPSHERLARAEIMGDAVTVYDIRNSTYRSSTDYDTAYYDQTFRLDELRRIWLAVEPFGPLPGLAHTLVSFEFADGSYLTISPELRRRHGQHFSLLRSLLSAGELMYVIASEADAIKLRTNYRLHDVYLYPLKAPPRFARRFFVGMLEHANRLREQSEPFHMLTSNCAVNLMREADALEPGLLETRFYSLFPSRVERLLARRGYIALNAAPRVLRRLCYVSDLARAAGGSPDFSLRIRARMLSALAPMPS